MDFFSYNGQKSSKSNDILTNRATLVVTLENVNILMQVVFTLDLKNFCTKSFQSR